MFSQTCTCSCVKCRERRLARTVFLPASVVSVCPNGGGADSECCLWSSGERVGCLLSYRWDFIHIMWRVLLSLIMCVWFPLCVLNLCVYCLLNTLFSLHNCSYLLKSVRGNLLACVFSGVWLCVSFTIFSTQIHILLQLQTYHRPYNFPGAERCCVPPPPEYGVDRLSRCVQPLPW